MSDNLVPLFISTITALMLGSAVWFDLRRDFVGTARRQAWLSISADGTVLLAVVYDYIGRSVYLFPQPVMVPHPLLPVRPGILCGTPAKMPGR
ncbi:MULTISPECIES: hypothetical protein [unclassified Mesorhizobium]|uniref:hypothetical protein n=1 Tax=unclassified Mesorhizobium TaxID=325217 RepID=UPI000F7583A1|nr:MULTISPECIES: hypothetical protein [unclassified Mesorhizobium]AZO28428.1 hypothetical protein EJ071_14115 [Mesorhizobium sp. M1B.F.Ca.ET.045.04.1.1]RWA66182.1 MAG: hypothetical protein EOQ29_26350 [Mesorhizobium sp.]RWA81767.1 MAG: hypothetical protein EOQ30_18575 [Mesorhizobium sp.]RWB18664.1 MAG: hypothetical protein EOQ40_23550 [Mesorhizobium sp.]TIS45543.1 MAG: hypothetical protein E5W96_30835 [Mesorhizobium sp.]